MVEESYMNEAPAIVDAAPHSRELFSSGAKRVRFSDTANALLVSGFQMRTLTDSRLSSVSS